ncbi:Transposase and inactivated derivatives, TnpA family [Andreprevotia lacus DSM 23236]|jgi:TnpA family transposase|uniref:Transposase and inactivated derivatives, TnpA family n=1 Tax=Andreprevotia lacus DSM 23236 TaxID=1121001 RepID=A0A1W1Y136_9NEIS|nr:Tn3 family transposase [Andreprevotia lacus]SMC29511.1 Transposase and inactivated derivatives, TnpA family [Andreprevotia lacus DSM 23236]
MASIERTAYPVFAQSYSLRELNLHFTPDEVELDWVKAKTLTATLRLNLAIQLKCFQYLRYFSPIEDIPPAITEHIRSVFGFSQRIEIGYEVKNTQYRHVEAIRDYLGITPAYGKAAITAAERHVAQAAQLMDQRIDIINAVIDGLVRDRIELPAFRTLDDLAERTHAEVQGRIFDTVMERISAPHLGALMRLMQTEDLEGRQSEYNELKRSARKPTKKHLEMLVDHLEWLESLGGVEDIFADIPETKVRHFAEQAMSYDVRELNECAPPRRFTLLLALIHRMQVRARDQLTEMFLRRVAAIHRKAKDDLAQFQLRQRGQLEKVAATFAGVLAIIKRESDDAEAGKAIREYVTPDTAEQMLLACEQIQANSGNNYLPRILTHFKSHRPVLFRLIHLLQIESASQDHSLIDALEIIKTYQDKHRVECINQPVKLSFASERWLKLLRRPAEGIIGIDRRMLEICVFSYVAEELRSGDLCVAGSEEFADYRKQLVPWAECVAMLPDYCEKVGLPVTSGDFVAGLRDWLNQRAQVLDDKFPHCHDVSWGSNGEPVLRKTVAREIPDSAVSLQNELVRRMPQRRILDVLANAERWLSFTRHFGPLSGNENKLREPAERYLMTIFAMGCNLGPTQAARHFAKSNVSPHTLSYVNRRHFSLENLSAAFRELTEVYLQLDLPKIWGDGKTVAADGTHYNFYDENLLTGQHFRYRKMGAVAYRHVANNYIAVFQHFIPPGVWEAIYVIEGLLKAGLSVQADTVHSDTQGQSASVFAFTHLLGIKLMPRIRSWKNLTLYRPEKNAKYQHINRLFKENVDWELLEKHWQDLMQVAISIYTGKISSATLLRKLGSYSRKNKLYDAAQVLGNIVRTGYLLDWMGDREMRQNVTAGTNKTESYNGFAKWMSFGGDVITVNEPDEQQKRLRYNDLIASSLILQNVVDMTLVLQEMRKDNWTITDEDLDFLSPYMTQHIKRFGDYSVTLKGAPEKWISANTFQQAATAARHAQRSTAPWGS